MTKYQRQKRERTGDDTSRRESFTGPCKVGWQEGIRRTVEALTS